METREELSLKDLAAKLEIDLSVARSLGKNALANQYLARMGHLTTRCEDCRKAGQYIGDLKKDIESTDNEK